MENTNTTYNCNKENDNNMEEKNMAYNNNTRRSTKPLGKYVINILARTAVLVAVLVALIAVSQLLVAESEMVYYHIKISSNEKARDKSLARANNETISDIEEDLYLAEAKSFDKKVELYSAHREALKSSSSSIIAFVARNGFRVIHTLIGVLGITAIILLFFAFRKMMFFKKYFKDISNLFGEMATVS